MSQETIELKAKIYDLMAHNESTTEILNKFALDIANIIELDTTENFTTDIILSRLQEIMDREYVIEREPDEPEQHQNLAETPYHPVYSIPPFPLVEPEDNLSEE